MERFFQVDSKLLRGGAPSEEEVRLLKDIWGVDKIVSLDSASANDIANVCSEIGLKHKIIPIENGNSPNISLLPAEVKNWLSDNDKVYVHCKHGKDRTGVAVSLYRIINGWPIEKALGEAKQIGMGAGLTPDNAETFYNAVYRLSGVDKNSTDDVVSLQRDNLAKEQHPPGHNNSFDAMPMQQSFAPYIDVEQAHLYDSASRYNQLLKLSNHKFELKRIYTYQSPNQIKTIWHSSPLSIIESENIYSAALPTDIVELDSPDKTLIQSAILNGANIIYFKQLDQYLVLNPKALNDIRRENIDQNETLDVGLHDNYTGVAPLVFPGTQGFMGGAGAVDLPFGSQF